MRSKLVAFVTASVACVFATAGAGQRDTGPEALAYATVNFGGSSQGHGLSNLQYGLLVDHDRRRVGAEVPAIFRLDFTPDGFRQASVNGMPFAQRATLVNRAGEEITYGIIDWSLLAVGVLGVGFVISEVADGEDDPDPVDGGGDTGGDAGGDTGGDGGGAAGGTPVGGTPLGGTPLGFASLPRHDLSIEDLERQIWLDGGAGQMGDLDPLD